MAKEDTRLSDVQSTVADDGLTAPIYIPAGRLDADEYAADDLDGVTESLFGSGNLNFLGLQAGQTDDALALHDAMDSQEDLIQDAAGADTNTDRPVLQEEGLNVEDAGGGQYTNGTVGSVSASQLSSDAGSFAPSLRVSNDADQSIDIVSSSAVSSSRNAQSSQSMVDNSSVRTSTDNSTTTTTVVEGDTLETITNSITEGDISETLNVINEITENTWNTATDLIENTILNNTTVNEITDTVTTTITNITEALPLGDISLDLDLGVLDTLGTNLSATISDGISGEIGTGLVADNVSGLLETVTGLNSSFLTADTLANIGFNLFNAQPTEEDGQDINVAGVDLPDISLDAVEALVGDLDINLSLPEIPTNVEDIADTVEAATDMLGGLSLDGLSDLDLSSQGLDGVLDLDILGNGLNEEFGTTVGEAQGILDDIMQGDIESSLDNVTDVLDGLGGGDALPDIADDILEGGDAGEAVAGIVATVSDLLGGLGSGNGGEEGDTDIVFTETDILPDISLDPVEALVGDIDIFSSNPDDSLTADAGGAIEDALGALADSPEDAVSGLSDDVQGILSDLLSGNGEQGDDTDIALGDTDINLDPIEEIVGDIDITPELLGDGALDDVLGLLDDVAGGDTLGDAVGDWTESIIGGDDMFGDLVDGGLGDILPDPSGTVGEGLGALDIPLDTGGLGGGLGGLFG